MSNWRKKVSPFCWKITADSSRNGHALAGLTRASGHSISALVVSVRAVSKTQTHQRHKKYLHDFQFQSRFGSVDLMGHLHDLLQVY